MAVRNVFTDFQGHILQCGGTQYPKIKDPGNGGAIMGTAAGQTSGFCPLTSAGAETRTLAAPLFPGQEIDLICDTYGGNIVLTVASAINKTGNNTITFGAAKDMISLRAMTVGGVLFWRVVDTDGVSLSTV